MCVLVVVVVVVGRGGSVRWPRGMLFWSELLYLSAHELAESGRVLYQAGRLQSRTLDRLDDCWLDQYWHTEHSWRYELMDV